MRTVSLPILLIACLLALPACGQKGPLTLPKDEPVESSVESPIESPIESQAPTKNPQAEENDNAPADQGIDDDGDQ